MPCASSTGAIGSNGAPTITRRASIMRSTRSVSSRHTSRSVRAVGWCSMVMLPPASQIAWATGAICTGAPASTATACPG
jgi:hypothetical protein